MNLQNLMESCIFCFSSRHLQDWKFCILTYFDDHLQIILAFIFLLLLCWWWVQHFKLNIGYIVESMLFYHNFSWKKSCSVRTLWKYIEPFSDSTCVANLYARNYINNFSCINVYCPRNTQNFVGLYMISKWIVCWQHF